MGKLREAMAEAIKARGLSKQHHDTHGVSSSNPPLNTHPYVPRGGRNQGEKDDQTKFKET
jgi:hypothetical protein